MAPFSEEDMDRLDYRLLRDGPIALYCRREVLGEDVAWFERQSYSVIQFDCTRWEDERALHDDLAHRLRFPEYYGRNMDALNDALLDVEVPQEGGLALQFLRFDRFHRGSSRTAWTLLDVIASAARQHLLFGRRLIALVQSDDPSLELPLVGATPASWNPREWASSDRCR